MTLFLIDDDLDDQEIFNAVIENIAPGCNCVTAANGKVALEMLLKKSINPDLVFLDLNMPLMNGMQFLTAIRTTHPHLKELPVIILSTSSDQKTKKSMIELGALDFITKPDRFSDWENALGLAIRNGIERHQ